MLNEQLPTRPVAVPEPVRSSREWGEVLKKTPDRVQAINAGRTKAIERAIGAEMSFSPEIATVSSTNELQSALTCTVAPMEGDTSMWSRITAAADLAFGARAMLRLRINDEKEPPERPNTTTHTIITEKISVSSGEARVDSSLPVVMEEVANPDLESKKGGVIRFRCKQNKVHVGTVEVAYRYAAQRALKDGAIPSRNEELAAQHKDTTLPPARDAADLTSVLGMDFQLTQQERERGFDAKYAPYPHCLNYWGSAHGSGLVAFATFGVPGIENGFDVTYPGAAIPEFPPDNPAAASTKVFYRRRIGGRIQIFHEEDLIHPVTEVQVRQSAAQLSLELDQVGRGTNPYLASLSGLQSDHKDGMIFSTIQHPDPALLPTYADQVFYLHTINEFGMAGPTKSIKVRSTNSGTDPSKPLEIRLSRPSVLVEHKGRRFATVSLSCVQFDREGTKVVEVASIQVECVLMTPEESVFNKGRVVTSSRWTRRMVANALRGVREYQMQQRQVTVDPASNIDDLLQAFISERKDENKAYESLRLNTFAMNLRHSIHGGVGAALALAKARDWKDYDVEYPRPGNPKKRVYVTVTENSIHLCQQGKDSWGQGKMLDFLVVRRLSTPRSRSGR